MEAIEFLKECRRMCFVKNVSNHCNNCPLKGRRCLATGIQNKTDSEILTITSAVEQWSKEHPIITNAQKFKEVFGDKAIYVIISSNVQAIGNWLDAPYKEP